MGGMGGYGAPNHQQQQMNMPPPQSMPPPMMQNPMMQQQNMGMDAQKFYHHTSKLVPSVKAENPHMK